MLDQLPPPQLCDACRFEHGVHQPGACPLKVAEVEVCRICGGGHFGVPGVCPFFKSEQKIGNMAHDLQKSPEAKHLKEGALGVLRQAKTSVVQGNKRKREPIPGKAIPVTASSQQQRETKNGAAVQINRTAPPNPRLPPKYPQSQGYTPRASQSAQDASLRGNASPVTSYPYLPRGTNVTTQPYAYPFWTQAAQRNIHDHQVQQNPYAHLRSEPEHLQQLPWSTTLDGDGHTQYSRQALDGVNGTRTSTVAPPPPAPNGSTIRANQPSLHHDTRA